MSPRGGAAAGEIGMPSRCARDELGGVASRDLRRKLPPVKFVRLTLEPRRQRRDVVVSGQMHRQPTLGGAQQAAAGTSRALTRAGEAEAGGPFAEQGRCIEGKPLGLPGELGDTRESASRGAGQGRRRQQRRPVRLAGEGHGAGRGPGEIDRTGRLGLPESSASAHPVPQGASDLRGRGGGHRGSIPGAPRATSLERAASSPGKAHDSERRQCARIYCRSVPNAADQAATGNSASAMPSRDARLRARTAATGEMRVVSVKNGATARARLRSSRVRQRRSSIRSRPPAAASRLQASGPL